MIFKKGLIVSCVLLAIFLSFRTQAFQEYELSTYDLRFKLSGQRPVSSEIIVIEISDDTLANLSNWPLPRDFHASLLEVLKEYGAKIVVFDLLFSEPTAYDGVFAESIKEDGNVYLGAAYQLQTKRQTGEVFDAERALSSPLNIFSDSARGYGHVNVLVDVDGKVRRVPLYVSSQGSVVPQLGLLVAADYLGVDPKELTLPLVNNSSFLVKYPGKWVDSFRHLSYYQILKSYTQESQGLEPEIDLSVLRDKVCFIGLTAAGTSDLRPTPLENVYPMLGLQASVFNSIIMNDFIRPVGIWINTLISFLLICIVLAICNKLSPLKALIASSIIAVGYTLLACFIFAYFGIWLSLFLPLLVILLVYIVVTSYRFFNEVKRRQILEKELEIARQIQQSFLPPALDNTSDSCVSANLDAAKFVGGDLYDIFKIDQHRIGVFIGDVSGKGVPAALIMAQTILLFRMLSRQIPEPKRVMEALNKELYAKFSGRFVTALYMTVDFTKGVLTVASAGHGPLLLCRKEDITEVEIDAGFPLGVTDDAEYKEVSFKTEEGDKYMIFTDGAYEARNAKNKEFGIEVLKNAFYSSRMLEVTRQIDGLKHKLKDYSGGREQHDDITMIILEIKRRGQ